MNDILNRGFAAPFIRFNFLNGTIDSSPPRYFMSFSQDRSVEQAASFTLTIIYVPGEFGESESNYIHNLLLTSVNNPVTYQYGYITPGGGLMLQNQWYRGQFISYTENLGNDGTLTYEITGIGESVEMQTPFVKIQDYLTARKAQAGNGALSKVQPSTIVEYLVTTDPDISKYFENFNIEIFELDDRIDVNSINVADGTLQEVFAGKYKADGTKSIGGFVSYSNIEFTPEQAIAQGLISDSAVTRNAERSIMISHGASSSVTAAQNEAHNMIGKIRKIPFVCFFDNVFDGSYVGSTTLKGTFCYKPKFSSEQPNNIYVYNFGNSYRDSDVLSFNVTNDCTPAFASAKRLNSVSADIGVTGESVGSSYNVLQDTGFKVNSYNTISGFNEAVFFSQSTLAEAFNFPYEATMEIFGQTECNKLLDKIRVNILFNNVQHPYLSGDYVILSISDEVSSSGFTTTFKLQRDFSGLEVENEVIANASDSKEATIEVGFSDDYKGAGSDS